MAVLVLVGCEGSPCLSDDVLDLLTDRVEGVWASGSLLAGHAGPLESVGQMMLPGYDGNVATYGILVEECDAASDFQEWCDGPICWQLACTGDGAGHETRARLADASFEAGELTFSEGTAVTRWDPTPDTLALTFHAVSDGPVDASADGAATVADSGTVSLDEDYPRLVAGGGVLLVTADDDGHAEGTFGTAGAVYADIVDGVAMATGTCPERAR